jgi:hypothetical protein
MQLNLIKFEFDTISSSSNKELFTARKEEIGKMFAQILLDIENLEKLKREKSSIDWLREDLVKEFAELKVKYLRNLKRIQNDIDRMEDHRDMIMFSQSVC